MLPLLYKLYGEQYITDWLYGDYDQQKYEVFNTLYSIDGVHQYFDYLLDKRRDAEYMNRNQLDWSDIHDPRKLRQGSSYSSTLNFVSSNIKRLYRR